MLEVGKQILSHPKMMDRVRNMSILCTLLASRDHLLDKASLVLAKVLLVYRVSTCTRHTCKRERESVCLCAFHVSWGPQTSSARFESSPLNLPPSLPPSMRTSPPPSPRTHRRSWAASTS
jgi:hypothetical protein